MKYTSYLYPAFAVMAWGTMFIALKFSLEVVSSLTLLLIRYAICLIILLIVYRNRKRPTIQKKDYKVIVFIGVFGYFVSTSIQMISAAMIDASMASLINTMTPVGILVFAIFMLKEKTNKRQNIGIAVTVTGAMVIIGSAGGSNGLAGILLGFLGMLVWALASVVIRKTCQEYDAVWITIYTTAIALVSSIPFVAIEISKVGVHLDALNPVNIFAMIWIGAVSTGAANLWWTKALERLPATTCSLFYPFLTLTTSTLGIFLLGEKLTGNFLIGSVLIICGMLYAILGEIWAQSGRTRNG